MILTRVFKSGNSQAVRLPIGFRFKSHKVEILKRGEEVILRETPQTLRLAYDLLTSLSEDCFSEDRQDSPPELREHL